MMIDDRAPRSMNCSIAGKRVVIRVEDNARFRHPMVGTIARVFRDGEFYFGLPTRIDNPQALLVRLDSPMSNRPAPEASLSLFRYVLLLVWDWHELVDLVETGMTKYRRSFHFYLLDEDRLSEAHISPERDDLDIRYTYGVSKEVEIGLVE